jgi:hypothetical protein
MLAAPTDKCGYHRNRKAISMETPHTSSAHRRNPRLTRRGVIGAAGAVAAGAALTPVVSAAEGGGSAGASGSKDTANSGTAARQFPKTRVRTATGTEHVNASFPITYVGMTWAGASARNAQSAQSAQIRFVKQDGAQGEWRSVSGAGCAQVNGGGTALVAGDSAAGYQVKAPAGASDVLSVAIDTTAGGKATVQVPADPTRMRGVEYLSRAAWGADEAKRYKDGKVNSPEKYYPAQAVTVHHTDTRNDDPDPAATVRAIYEYHAVTLDWGDIGYHFLIDEAGTIYEGRYSGDDGIPAHDRDGDVVTAFHTLGFNAGNLGIALLGDLADRSPTGAAKQSLVMLIAMLTRYHGLDPKARITYKNPVNGVTKDLTTVSGHRDWLATNCPGATMYALLDEVVAAAAEHGGSA